MKTLPIDDAWRRQQLAKLLAADQLKKELATGTPFAGFLEPVVDFPPTYRMEKGRAEYNNKKNQNPSYTDRILWRSLNGLEGRVSPLFYAADMSLLLVRVVRLYRRSLIGSFYHSITVVDAVGVVCTCRATTVLFALAFASR